MRGLLQGPSTGEVEALLEKPNVTTEQLLRCPNISQQFRAENRKLLSRLVNREGMCEIIEVIRRTPDRNFQKSIFSLFQTNNTSFHQLFADDQLLTESVISILNDTNSPLAGYAEGVVSRLLSRAMDLWSDELSDIFRLSKTIYPTAIRHLTNSVVFQFVLDAMAESHPGIVIFLWNCFIAVRGRKAEPIPKSKRPKLVYSTRDVTIDFDISPALRNSIILILKNYFETSKNKDKELGQAILDHISVLPEEEFTEKWYDLAKAIGPSREIALRAYRVCCTQSSEVKLCERALGYLAVGAEVLNLQRVEKVLLCTMIDDRITNIGYIGWLNIIKMYCPPIATPPSSRGQWQLKDNSKDEQILKEKVPKEIKEQFQNEMTSILGFLWNRFRARNDIDRMKRSFVMEAAVLIEEPLGPIARWKEFRQWIRMWKNAEANWSSTPFDGDLYTFNGGWRQDFIDSLQKMVSPR
jgi:hypothetical protein